jgi:polyisoprenoid-binding protein YceI
MKKIALSLGLLAAFSASTYAGELLTIDGSHSAVVFQWSHFGFSNPVARLEKVEGTLDLDQADMTRSSVNVSMPLEGLRTGDDFLNKRVKGGEFLDAEHYPAITFRSTRVEKLGADKLAITGDLTAHGITKSVVLNAHINKIAPNPFTKLTTVGFDADTVIHRSDFGAGKYAPAVTDEMTVHISLAADVHPKEEAGG